MNTPYELIAKYLRNECSPEEIQSLETWKNASSRNQQLFLEFKNDWKYVNADSPEVIPDKEDIWNRILPQLHSVDSPLSYSRRLLIKYASIAASIALLVGIGSVFIYQSLTENPTNEYQLTEFQAPKGQKAQVLLPDGTSVWLNSGSSLSYATNFNEAERRVELKGEAFFDVAHDSGKKFIVDSEGISVCVHGTKFNLEAYEEDAEVKISLLQGSVSVIDQQTGKELSKLAPDQMAVVSKENLNCRIIPDNAAITSLWTQSVLRIYDENIVEVSKKLERWYGVNIHVDQANLRYRYSFVVKTESLRELLPLLNKMTPINYTIEGEEVHIK